MGKESLSPVTLGEYLPGIVISGKKKKKGKSERNREGRKGEKELRKTPYGEKVYLGKRRQTRSR